MFLSFEKACEAFRFRKQVDNCSPRTIAWYDEKLANPGRFLRSKYPAKPLDRIYLNDIGRDDILEFIASLQGRETLYEHANREPVHRKLSPYTVHSNYRAACTFFRWALADKLIASNPMEGLKRPQVPKAIKDRFSESDLERMLKSCEEGQATLQVRNRALVLFLLDTGVRASELCALTPECIDGKRVHVIAGKGAKDRTVFLGIRAQQALFTYVNLGYRPAPKRENRLFLTQGGRPLNKTSLGHILTGIGDRAGVHPCNAHRFRHSCARYAIRNGMDLSSLQAMLGHESLSTTNMYLKAEREDVEHAHERCSPVDRLGL